MMLCEKPFVRVAKVIPKGLILSEEYRRDSTPFPCGKCFACRVNKAALWQTRILLEQLTNKEACFVTITYDDEHLPEDGSLCPDDVTAYIKRIRSAFNKTKIRYYYSGEYGTHGERPHYHVIFFGIGIEQEEKIRQKWNSGFVMVGDLNKFTARYTSGYVVKGWCFDDCKKLNGRHKEFQRMSRKPGLGHDAMIMIADKVKEKGLNNAIKDVFQGKKKMMLGRYLLDILDTSLGTTEIRKLEYYDYMTSFFQAYIGKGDLLNNYIEDTEQKREILKKRHKIYNKRNKI